VRNMMAIHEGKLVLACSGVDHIASFAPVLIAVPLFLLAALLIAWGLTPKATEDFIGRLPYSNYLLRALAKLDSMISG
jgi:hypothetical protein